jgi:hypothetical protein
MQKRSNQFVYLVEFNCDLPGLTLLKQKAMGDTPQPHAGLSYSSTGAAKNLEHAAVVVGAGPAGLRRPLCFLDEMAGSSPFIRRGARPN